MARLVHPVLGCLGELPLPSLAGLLGCLLLTAEWLRASKAKARAAYVKMDEGGKQNARMKRNMI